MKEVVCGVQSLNFFFFFFRKMRLEAGDFSVSRTTVTDFQQPARLVGSFLTLETDI